MNAGKIIYFVTTGLLSLLMGSGAVMYFVKYNDVAKEFTKLGFPTYIIYPLAIAKIAGIVAIWTKMSWQLKEWAYAGFFFNLLLALSAHLVAQDNEVLPPAIGIVLLFTSYFSEKYATK